MIGTCSRLQESDVVARVHPPAHVLLRVIPTPLVDIEAGLRDQVARAADKLHRRQPPHRHPGHLEPDPREPLIVRLQGLQFPIVIILGPVPPSLALGDVLRQAKKRLHDVGGALGDHPGTVEEGKPTLPVAQRPLAVVAVVVALGVGAVARPVGVGEVEQAQGHFVHAVVVVGAHDANERVRLAPPLLLVQDHVPAHVVMPEDVLAPSVVGVVAPELLAELDELALRVRALREVAEVAVHVRVAAGELLDEAPLRVVRVGEVLESRPRGSLEGLLAALRARRTHERIGIVVLDHVLADGFSRAVHTRAFPVKAHGQRCELGLSLSRLGRRFRRLRVVRGVVRSKGSIHHR
mmetsp:Transcript_2053/g.3954  ORF Transcript_2053/g.3954 Transcript_2053/m.3954 type:complete len:350 (-) Transcript_2053:265-1314(-)